MTRAAQRRRIIAPAVLTALAVLLPIGAAMAQATLPAVAIKTAADGAQTYSLTFQVLILMTLADAAAGASAGDDGVHAHHHRAVDSAAGTRHGDHAIEPGAHRPGAVPHVFRDELHLNQSYADGIRPYLDGQLAGETALDRTLQPLKKFMLAQTRENDLQLFSKLSGKAQFASADEVPLSVLVPTFLTSELKTAFQIGFMVFIPFLVIDLVVASVLMSMGMMMLSPVLVSLPFKIMLFVVVDGWTLLMGTLAASFHR